MIGNHKTYYGLWLTAFFLIKLPIVSAGLVFVTEEDKLNSNILTLDSDDIGSDIQLQFGNTLNESLKWNDANNNFELSDDLNLLDAQLINTRIENEAAAPTCDGTVKGKIYHNTTDTLSYICDGSSWKQIDGGGATQFTASIANNTENLFTNAADPSFKRIVDIYYENNETVNDSTTWNILTAEEGLYVQENASITDFPADSIKLQSSGPPAPGGTNLAIGATANSSDNSRPPSLGNDNNTTTYWYNQSGGTPAGQWWSVDLGAPKTVMQAQINWYSAGYRATTMRIEGSADGTTWTTVATVTPAGTVDETWSFAPTTFRYWRYYCVAGANPSYFVLREGRFFEALYTGFSTTPAYVTSDNGKEINTTTWATLNSITPTVDEPVNTELRWLFSFDGGTVWRGFSGGTWNIHPIADIETVGMTTAEVVAMTSANWMAANGFNSGDNTFNFATSLKTTDSNVTPTVTSLTLNYDTSNYWQKVDGTTAQIRLYDSTTTGVKNLTGSTKNFKVNIITP